LPEIAPGAEEVQLDATQLAMLLDGIDDLSARTATGGDYVTAATAERAQG